MKMSDHCTAGHCDRMPCFEARFKPPGGAPPTRVLAGCADHLVDTVQALAAWARGCGLTRGQVEVLVIDLALPVRAAGPQDTSPLEEPFPFASVSIALAPAEQRVRSAPSRPLRPVAPRWARPAALAG